MKIRQTLQHFAAKKSLTLPLVGEKVRAKLVELHTSSFLDRAPEAQREERRDRLEVFFDASMDVYLAALEAGMPEAKARELTHLLANLEFYRMGWTEMMELPPKELAQDLDRYEAFLTEHEIAPEQPLGAFTPEDGLPDAPATPEKRRDPETPFAEAGFAGATYVEDDEGRIRREP